MTTTVTRKKTTKRVTTKNTPEQLTELSRIADSPSSSKEDLTKAWKSTKSTAIRKKIASNGNADTDILKMSARLYLKEVLQNPSFELIELFVEDPFIKSLKKAYQDPSNFVNTGDYHGFRYSDQRILWRACLLSPRITYKVLMEYLLRYLPPDAFRRELQDRDVFNRIKSIVGQEFDFTSVRSKKWDIVGLHRLGRNKNYDVDYFFTLYKSGVIPESYIYDLLYKVGANSSSNFGSNSIAINLIIKNIELGEVEKATKLMLMGNYSTFSSIGKRFMSSNLDIKPQIKTLVQCFKSIVEMVTDVGWGIAAKSGEAYTPNCLHGIITDILINLCLNTTKKKDMVGIGKEDFIRLYDLYKEVGFFEYANLFLQDRVTISDAASLYALNECPREVIEFILFSNFLKPKITISKCVSNIINILEDVNCSGSIEEVLYDRLDLDYIKRIRYDENRMRIKGLVHYGYDLRKYPVYHSRYYYGGRMPQDLLDMWNRGRNSQNHPPTIPLSLTTQRILNMTQ